MLYILNVDQETVGIASNDNPYSLPYFNDIHDENLEGVSTYEFSVPSDHEFSGLLEVEGHVILPDLDGDLLLFTIKSIAEGNDDGKRIKVVSCENTAITELLSCPQRPIDLPATTIENAGKSILSSAFGWKIGEVEDISTFDFKVEDYQTVLQTLQDLATQQGMELYYTVTLDGTRIKDKYVHFAVERGNDTGVRFDYGYDLKGVGRTEDSSNIVTALIAVGKGDTEGKRLSLIDVGAWDDGDIYHDQGTDWLGSEDALQRYGKNGQHRFGIFISEDADTLASLKRKAIKELKDRCTPYVNYSSSILNLERITGYDSKQIRIGDRLVISDTTYNPPIVISARVTELKRSYTNPNADEVDLGNYKPITLTYNKALKKLQQSISLKEKAWDEAGAVAGIVNDLSQTVSEIEDRTTPAVMIPTIVYSEDFTSIFDNKADVQDIADMATGEELSEVQSTIVQYVDGRIDGEGGINEEINKVTSSLEKTASSIDAKFKSSGGINLIKNSIGYGGLDLWKLERGGFQTIQNADLELLGFGSGFYSPTSPLATVNTLSQDVIVTPGEPHSLSVWINKTVDNLSYGGAYVEVWEGTQQLSIIGKASGQGTTNGWELGLYTFTPTLNQVTIKMLVGSNAEATFSGLMLNIGEVPLQWQHADGEVYNTNIQMNLNGIKVLSETYNGYTIMSPQEFSGYAQVPNEDNEPVMTRVFSLNKDVTEVSKLDADLEINMNPMKIVPVKGTRKGWAFISND